MPDLSQSPVRTYQPTDPYHHEVDNGPILDLIQQITLVNAQVDIDANILRNSIGSMGTLSARLAVSIEDDGTLKKSAVDATLHNIAEHVDGTVLVGPSLISYVRMLYDERAKLNGVADGATNLVIQVDVDDATIPSSIPSAISLISYSEVLYTEGKFRLKPSDSITWRVDTTGAIVADTTFPAAARHQHFYDFTPAHQSPTTPDYKNYLTTSVATPYKEGTLRVYINGVRLSNTQNIYVPRSFTISGPSWTAYSYDEGTATDGVVTGGDFALTVAIDSSDVIRIDFDALYS